MKFNNTFFLKLKSKGWPFILCSISEPKLVFMEPRNIIMKLPCYIWRHNKNFRVQDQFNRQIKDF